MPSGVPGSRGVAQGWTTSLIFSWQERIAWRKLAMLDAAEVLADLRVPPGNRLEKLTGNRAGQYSIRINRQWRICFSWSDAGPEDVEIVDYH
jgi:toxin HigB-1